MHPAYSVILFTVTSGAGFGLLFLTALGAGAGLFPDRPWFGPVSVALALVLMGAGLLASTFHLGHPERAWRAYSQWRSSWLSREGVAATAAFPAAALFVYGWNFGGGDWWPIAAFASALLAVISVICTAMIYASLKPIRQWRNPYVVPVYLALALMSGALILQALLALFDVTPNWASWTAAAASILALLVKLGYWNSISKTTDAQSAPQALGMPEYDRARMFDPPHSEENYLLEEMGYSVARKHARRLWRLVAVFGFLAPFVLSVLMMELSGAAAIGVSILAVLSGYLGMLIERWLFFAEATHTVTLYYGADTA